MIRVPTPLYHVDAFADGPFRGNPASVCVLAGPVDAAWMQRVAAEMNHPETAFVRPQPSHGGPCPTYEIRWFSPTIEVELCGHATLAAAFVLFQTGRARDTVAFQTLHRGTLTCRRDDSAVAMTFPADPPRNAPPPPGLLDALGVTDAVNVTRTTDDWLVELPHERDVRRLQPNIARLAQIETRGVGVTARGETHDIVSRFFAPRTGIAEDPVTGSLHCALGPYWQRKLGKDELHAFQASPRGGTLRVITRDDRVELIGQAVMISEGLLLV